MAEGPGGGDERRELGVGGDQILPDPCSDLHAI